MPRQITAGTWARSFLTAAAAPPTRTNVEFVLRWMARENGMGTWNPLGLNGAMDYASFPAGVSASAGNLSHHGGLAMFLAALRVSKPTSAAALASLDTWGGRPGYGATVASTPPVASGATDLNAFPVNAQTMGFIPGGGLITGVGLGLPESIAKLNPLEPIASIAREIGLIVNFFTSPETYIRLAEVLAGGVLVMVGLWIVVTTTDSGQDASSKVKGAATAAAA